jgi:hypothetical protein
MNSPGMQGPLAGLEPTKTFRHVTRSFKRVHDLSENRVRRTRPKEGILTITSEAAR